MLLVNYVMNIIYNYKKAFNIKLNNKKDYYELCKNINNLPLDPEKYFGDLFPGWFYYLGLNEKKYYDKLKAKKIIFKLITDNLLFLQDKDLNDSNYLYEFCRSLDNKLPPFPCECYKIDNVSELIPKFEKD